MCQFYDPGQLTDGELRLILTDTLPTGPKVEAPTYCFAMRVGDQEEVIGRINFRAADTDNIVLYRGHVGYSVEPAYRGHRHALRACRLLLPLAQRHNLAVLWITCDPDNLASRRTCELLGATLVETIDVAEDTPAYRAGARRKCRYRLDLSGDAMNALTIDPAAAGDAKAIVEAHFAAVHQTAASFYPAEILNDWSQPVADARVERMTRAILERQELCLVARQHCEIIGFGSVVPENNELRSLYVHPSVGRQGIGSKPLCALEASALAAGAAFLEMDASLNAETFYAAHGYQIILRGVHHLHSGQKMACVRMRKSLTDDLYSGETI